MALGLFPAVWGSFVYGGLPRHLIPALRARISTRSEASWVQSSLCMTGTYGLDAEHVNKILSRVNRCKRWRNSAGKSVSGIFGAFILINFVKRK